MGYSYRDTPDGEDCFKKLWYTTKLAAVFGVTVSTTDVLLYTKPQGYVQTLARYGYFTLPFVGMAAAFTSTVCAATSLRKKDDPLNYLIGGVTAGYVGGIWQRSGFTGFRLALLFGLMGVVTKHCHQNGWSLIDIPVIQKKGSLNSVRHDYTLTSERPKNWVVTAE